MSLLIFGLGAAALLRAAHESFASNSSWRAAPEVSFAQHPDTTLPMLATLRVEPPAIEKPTEAANITAIPADPEPSAAETAGSEKVAASRSSETLPADVAGPAELPASMPLAENPPVPVATSVGTVSPTGETTNAADEKKMAAVTARPPASVNSEPAAAQAEPAVPPEANSTTDISTTTPPPAPEASIAATKIATLGGPPVDIVDDASASAAKSDRAKPDEAAMKNRVHARRTLHRRRLAARARYLAQQQLQMYPFTQPQQTFPPAAPRQQ